MDYLKIKKDNLELTVTSDFQDEVDVIMGGLDKPSWDDYLMVYKEEKEHMKLIRIALEKLNWIGNTAKMRADDTRFIFSDGVKMQFTWRAWGDLMQATINQNEGYQKYLE